MAADVLPGVPLGTRVVVRYLIEGGDRATDALGELIARDATSLQIQTRRGVDQIAVTSVVAAKVVPPPPPPRHRRPPSG